jgi:hypothetical protein
MSIIAHNAEAGRKAAERSRLPFVIENELEIDAMPPFPFPNFGDYEPEGWEPLDIWFVNAGGKDERGPALSISSFKVCLKEYLEEHAWATIGFAIIEEGEFQVHVQAFRKIPEDDDGQ